MGWALGTLDVPTEYCGPLMDAFRKLDYVEIPH
jgi:antitoxin CptB